MHNFMETIAYWAYRNPWKAIAFAGLALTIAYAIGVGM